MFDVTAVRLQNDQWLAEGFSLIIWLHGRRKGGRAALASLDFETWHFPIKFLAKKVF